MKIFSSLNRNMARSIIWETFWSRDVSNGGFGEFNSYFSYSTLIFYIYTTFSFSKNPKLFSKRNFLSHLFQGDFFTHSFYTNVQITWLHAISTDTIIYLKRKHIYRLIKEEGKTSIGNKLQRRKALKLRNGNEIFTL